LPVKSVTPRGGAGTAKAAGTLVRSLRAQLRVLEREIGRSLATQTDCCGVTMAQCHILLELDGAGCVNLKTLSERMELDKSTLSRTVDALVGLELVSRGEDPANRRQQIICLSDAGTLWVADVHRRCDAFYQRLLERIPAAKHGAVLESVSLLARSMVEQRKDSISIECF